ncbi:MAG: DMT family transporter [Comamonadaceae bacterium]
MTHKLTPKAALFLFIPPILWAGNAIVGRIVAGQIPPMTLNFLRWSIALAILTPFLGRLWAARQSLREAWLRLAMLGLAGMGCYNSFQYLALQTSTAVNVTLVAASMPVWVLVIGRLFFAQQVSKRAWLGAALSLLGVSVVLLQGDLRRFGDVALVPGDGWMILATWAWATYSWLLSSPNKAQAAVGQDWLVYLMAQILFGVMWSASFTTAEWILPVILGNPEPQILWDATLVMALAYVAICPALLAYKFWGAGIALAGATTAGFFANLTPLFAATFSTLFLGEAPHLYHLVAFALIIMGIVVSSRKRG